MSELVHLPSQLVLLYMGGVVAILLPSSLFVLLYPGLQGPAKKKTRMAILSWWPVFLYWSVPCAFGRGPALLFTALLSIAALREYLRMLPASDRHPLLDTLAYLSLRVILWLARLTAK